MNNILCKCMFCSSIIADDVPLSILCVVYRICERGRERFNGSILNSITLDDETKFLFSRLLVVFLPSASFSRCFRLVRSFFWFSSSLLLSLWIWFVWHFMWIMCGFDPIRAWKNLSVVISFLVLFWAEREKRVLYDDEATRNEKNCTFYHFWWVSSSIVKYSDYMWLSLVHIRMIQRERH